MEIKLIIMILMAYILTGCGSDPEVACDAYVAPAGSNSGGVTDSSCDAGGQK